MTASVVTGPVLVRVTSKLSPRQYEALQAYAETGNQALAAHRIGVTPRTLKDYLTVVYLKLGVASAVEAFRVMGWLNFNTTGAQLADIEARLAAIHADSGALLAELRGAA